MPRAVSAKAYAGQSWLDHVQGCACCLTRTQHVSPCYLAAKGCGDNGTLAECCSNDGLPQEKNKASTHHACCAPQHLLRVCGFSACIALKWQEHRGLCGLTLTAFSRNTG